MLLVKKYTGKSLSEYNFNHRNYLIYNRLQIVKYNPSPKNYFELGVAYAKSDTYGGKEAYKKAIALDSDFTDAYTNLAYICCLRGEWDEAIIYSKKALKLNPCNNFALGSLNLALRSKK